MIDTQQMMNAAPEQPPLRPRRYLNETEVLAMRRAYKNDERMTYGEIAAQYGISPLNAHLVITGKTWKHVPEASADNRVRNRRRGAGRAHPRFTVEQVVAMVTLYDKNPDITYTDLARTYRCSKQIIANVFGNLEYWLPEGFERTTQTVARGASRRGENHPFVKLNDKQVAELRELRASDKKKYTLQALSERTGMSPSGISRILRGLTRSDASGPLETNDANERPANTSNPTQAFDTLNAAN